MPEVKGTIKVFSKSRKGFILNEYDDQWFNRGKGLEGAWPATVGEAVTVTFESSFDADGVEKFWVLEVWPTSTGKPAPGPKPTAGPTPTNGPIPTPEATGPVPTPPDRDKYILYEVCLKEAREWVLQKEPEESPQRTEGHWIAVTDRAFLNALSMITSKVEVPEDGEPGPEEPA